MRLSTLLANAFVASASLSSSQAKPISNFDRRDLSFNYGNTKVYGVNLGGWFVLEPWITPSIFQAVPGSVDEFTLCQMLGPDAAKARLSAHWNSFIDQSDFQTIAEAGLNHVRIPIGYWAVVPLSGDPYVSGQLDVLDKAIGWARDAKLKVIIDLHGAPGSQNGFDNSGRRGDVLWTQGSTVQQTLDAVRGLAKRYASQTDVVTAIELLNEPASFKVDINTIKQFYYDGWGTVRESNQDTLVMFHDAFETPSYWNGFESSGFNNVALDTHQYQIFSPAETGMSPAQHIETACNLGRTTLAGLDKTTIVGEWTGAQTDCAFWLNGVDRGARYDNTFPGSYYSGSCDGKRSGTVAGLSADDKHNLRMFIEAQLDAYERVQGWIFWTWKNEAAPEWHMKDLLANGLFPKTPTERQFPNQCGY